MNFLYQGKNLMSILYKRGVSLLTQLPLWLALAILAAISGASLTLAFAPFGYYYLAITSLVVLLATWYCSSSPRQALYYGLIFGIAFFSTSISWVYISIYHYGNAPLGLALLLTTILVLVMALYPALVGYLLTRFFSHKNMAIKFMVAFPALFVSLEWIRSWVLTGFPWMLLGYSQIDAPFKPVATLFGVYGLSFLVAHLAGLLLVIIVTHNKRQRWLGLCYATTLLLVSCFIKPVDERSTQDNNQVEVVIVQGNTLQELKWREDRLSSILKLHYELTVPNLGNNLIVWPEAAIPAFKTQVPNYIAQLTQLAKSKGTTILTGIPVLDTHSGLYYNAIMALGTSTGEYHKRRLVPFGEYLPLRPLLKWLERFILIPMSDFSNGGRQQPRLMVNSIIIAPFICYEIAYPNLILEDLPQANLIVTSSDDSWFGQSMAQHQHLEIARMRSLEVGRDQVFSTNTGISALINHRGEIIAKTREFRTEVLKGKVRILQGATFWVAYGQFILAPMILLCLAYSLLKCGRRK